jgi:hypothetical protein
VQPNISEVSLRYMLNIGIVERVVLCVEKITFVSFLSNCWEFKICNFGFHICKTRDMKFEMPSELKTGTAQRRRSGKRIKKM